MLTCLLLIFWAIFGGKEGVSTTRDPNSLGPPNPNKKLANRMDLLGQPLSRNRVFEFSGLNSSPPLTPMYINMWGLGVVVEYTLMFT